LVSVVGQAVLQTYVHDDSVVTPAVLSVLGSVFLAVAIILVAATTRRPSSSDHLAGTLADHGPALSRTAAHVTR
jgi:hypothetical protein